MNQIPNIEETHNTREVEEIVEEIGNLLQEGQYQKAVSTLHHQLQKAREEERERLFKNPLELFRGNRIKMTAEAREALLMAVDIIPDHSELDQDNK
jgi:hypothetical protein